MDGREQIHEPDARAAIGVIDAYPGPALMCAPDGTILHANEMAGIFVSGVPGSASGQIVEAMRQGLREVAETRSACNWTIKTRIERNSVDEVRTFLVNGLFWSLPDSAREIVVILTWDTTMEANLRDALINSRTFFKELADFAGDFVWTTDALGRFSYISPSGASGMRGADLYGRRAVDVFQSPDFDTARLFRAREKIEHEDIWITKEGRRSCFRLSAEPVYNEEGTYTGARGVGRDVTELKLKEAELSRMRRLEGQVSQILQAMRSEADPKAILGAAANAVAAASGVTGCWIFCRSSENFNATSADVIPAFPGGVSDKTDLLEKQVREHVERCLNDHAEAPYEWQHETFNLIAAPARYGAALLGVVCIAIPHILGTEDGSGRRDRLEGAAMLVTNVVDQISAALALVEKHEHLKVLSHTDSLTGLVNRRAFYTEARRRLSHHKRSVRPAALLYIDLDNFKTVNDRHGHGAGDELLRTVAKVLLLNTRESDIGVRFGGDEFGLWMEESDLAAAELKANDLLEQVQNLSNLMPDAAPLSPEGNAPEMPVGGISMSIGIAVFDNAHSESLESLINRADSALYVTKKDGKGGYRIAPPLPAPANMVLSSAVGTGHGPDTGYGSRDR